MDSGGKFVITSALRFFLKCITHIEAKMWFKENN